MSGSFKVPSGSFTAGDLPDPYVLNVPHSAKLAVHFDANAITASGTTVTSWPETSGNLTPSSEALANVQYNATGKNGLPTAEKVNSNAVFSIAGGDMSHSGNYSIFVAHKPQSLTSYGHIILKSDWGTNGPTQYQLSSNAIAGNKYYSYAGQGVDGNRGQSIESNTGVLTTTWQIMEVHHAWTGSQTNVTYIKDGASAGSGSIASQTVNATNIGSMLNHLSDYAEICIFNDSLSVGEKADVRNYLNTKWAIY